MTCGVPCQRRDTAGRGAGGVRGHPRTRCLRGSRGTSGHRTRRRWLERAGWIRLRRGHRRTGGGCCTRRWHDGGAWRLVRGIRRAWSHWRCVARRDAGIRRLPVRHLRPCGGSHGLSSSWVRRCCWGCGHWGRRWLNGRYRWCGHRHAGGIRVRLPSPRLGSGRFVARSRTTVTSGGAWANSRQLAVVLGTSGWVHEAILGRRDFVKYLRPLGSAGARSNASHPGSSSFGRSRDH